MIFLNNKYTMYYYRIINNATTLTRPRQDCELHHIVPESFYINRTRKGRKGWLPGDPESSSNKVMLTLREHYICHLLLVKMAANTEAHSKMAKALNRLVSGKNKLTLTSRMYAIVKKELRKAQTGKGNSFYGKKHTKESNEARSKTLTGLKRSTESRKNYAVSKIGANNPGAKLVTCPNCGVTGKAGGMRKHHFDHCTSHIIYKFRHITTGELFVGTRNEFIGSCLDETRRGSVSNMIHGRANSVKGWAIIR